MEDNINSSQSELSFNIWNYVNDLQERLTKVEQENAALRNQVSSLPQIHPVLNTLEKGFNAFLDTCNEVKDAISNVGESFTGSLGSFKEKVKNIFQGLKDKFFNFIKNTTIGKKWALNKEVNNAIKTYKEAVNNNYQTFTEELSSAKNVDEMITATNNLNNSNKNAFDNLSNSVEETKEFAKENLSEKDFKKFEEKTDKKYKNALKKIYQNSVSPLKKVKDFAKNLRNRDKKEKTI